MKNEAKCKPRTTWADVKDDEDDGPIIIPAGRPVIADAAFYGPLGEITLGIAPCTEADPVAIYVQLLATYGNNIGRQAFCMAEQAHHFANIFANIVGPTSHGRKGTSLNYALRLIEQADPTYSEQVVTGLSSGEGVIHVVRDPVKKTVWDKETASANEIIADVGVSDKRLLVIEQEFAKPIKVMSGPTNTLSGVLRLAWDTGDLRIVTKTCPDRATDAHISVIGHITPEELLFELPECHFFNGFANRFLWFWSERVRLLPAGGVIAKEVMQEFVMKLQRALNLGRQIIGEVVRDEEAAKHWNTVYEELTTGTPGRLGKVLDRGAAQVVRLSLNLALADGSRVVTLAHLRAALAIWDYCVESARKIFGDRLNDPDAQKILDALRATPEGMARKQILDAVFLRHISSDRLTSALQLLVDHKLARPVTEPTAGKPAQRWFIGGPDGARS